MERLLNYTYKAPTRPYSQNELSDTRDRNLSRLRVGSTMISHERCQHFYFAKDGGKKEARMIESNGEDPGYCSVCWKLKKTPPELRQKAVELIEEYQHRFSEKPARWTHYMVELEKAYYRFLYFETDRRKRKSRAETAPDPVPPHQTEADETNPGLPSVKAEEPSHESSKSEVPALPRRWESPVIKAAVKDSPSADVETIDTTEDGATSEPVTPSP